MPGVTTKYVYDGDTIIAEITPTGTQYDLPGVGYVVGGVQSYYPRRTPSASTMHRSIYLLKTIALAMVVLSLFGSRLTGVQAANSQQNLEMVVYYVPFTVNSYSAITPISIARTGHRLIVTDRRYVRAINRLIADRPMPGKFNIGATRLEIVYDRHTSFIDRFGIVSDADGADGHKISAASFARLGKLLKAIAIHQHKSFPWEHAS